MVDSSPTDAAALAGATVVIANLPSPMIGETIGNSIVIDPTAGGFGWFVDPTPLNDSEFADRIAPTELMAGPGSPAAGRMDLLTVVMHELGHVVGLNDVNTAAHPFDLMATDLAAGVRRLPDGSPASTPIAGAPVGSASGAFQVAAPPVTRTSEAQLANALDRSTAASLFSLSRPSVIGLVPSGGTDPGRTNRTTPWTPHVDAAFAAFGKDESFNYLVPGATPDPAHGLVLKPAVDDATVDALARLWLNDPYATAPVA